jgi:hypothetical protein
MLCRLVSRLAASPLMKLATPLIMLLVLLLLRLLVHLAATPLAQDAVRRPPFPLSSAVGVLRQHGAVYLQGDVVVDGAHLCRLESGYESYGFWWKVTPDAPYTQMCSSTNGVGHLAAVADMRRMTFSNTAHTTRRLLPQSRPPTAVAQHTVVVIRLSQIHHRQGDVRSHAQLPAAGHC